VLEDDGSPLKVFTSMKFPVCKKSAYQPATFRIPSRYDGPINLPDARLPVSLVRVIDLAHFSIGRITLSQEIGAGAIPVGGYGDGRPFSSHRPGLKAWRDWNVNF
jgi:hypothetical protein